MFNISEEFNKTWNGKKENYDDRTMLLHRMTLNDHSRNPDGVTKKLAFAMVFLGLLLIFDGWMDDDDEMGKRNDGN